MSPRDLESLDQDLREKSSAARGPEHPDVDTLVLYLSEGMPSDQQLEVQQHLAECPACASAILDMKSFPEVEERGLLPTYDPQRRQQDWDAIMQAVESPQLTSAPDNEPRTETSAEPTFSAAPKGDPDDGGTLAFPARRPATGPATLPWLVAALLAVTTTGLSWKVLDLQPTQPGASSMQVNVLVHDLLSAEEGTTRSEQTVETIDVTNAVTSIVLIMNVEKSSVVPGIGAALRNVDGELLLEQEGLEAAAEGHYSVALPLALLHDGRIYELEVFGRDQGLRVSLQTYFFRLQLNAPT